MVEDATMRPRAASQFCAMSVQRLAGRIAALAVLLFTSTVTGCGPAEPLRVKVAGQVTLDGSPLEAGEIQFVPPNGRPASATIEAEGRFDLTSATVGDPAREGVVPGKYQVAVSTVQIVDDETVTWSAPQKYANHATSGIEVVIDQATDSLIIDLSSVDDVIESKGSDLREQVELTPNERKVQDELAN